LGISGYRLGISSAEIIKDAVVLGSSRPSVEGGWWVTETTRRQVQQLVTWVGRVRHFLGISFWDYGLVMHLSERIWSSKIG
jgi:hypothetical protein